MSSPYRADLLGLFHRYVVSEFGAIAPSEEHFMDLAAKCLAEGTTRRAAVYASDLWEMFRPDFRERLPAYYEALALPNTIRFIDYASNEGFIVEHFLAPYEKAAELLGKLSVLEVGSGVPHGLIRTILERPGVIEAVAINDIDAPYTRFTRWFCEREGVPVEWIPAIAGETTPLPERRFNFVFAKDVFEHLFDPEAMVEQVLASVVDEAVLALDLGDKGARVYQHVSPELSQAKAIVIDRGFRPIGQAGDATIFVRQ